MQCQIFFAPTAQNHCIFSHFSQYHIFGHLGPDRPTNPGIGVGGVTLVSTVAAFRIFVPLVACLWQLLLLQESSPLTAR